MKFEDFTTDEVFYTATGRWVCVDKGLRSGIIIAVTDCDWDAGYRHGAYWIVDFVVFCDYDFEGCSKNKYG